MPFFTYMLRCADGSYYVGHTDDLERRLSEHAEGGRCAYTQTRRPVVLMWSDIFSIRDEAWAVEKRIKKWSRAKKEALARNDLASLRQLARKKKRAARRV